MNPTIGWLLIVLAVLVVCFGIAFDKWLGVMLRARRLWQAWRCHGCAWDPSRQAAHQERKAVPFWCGACTRHPAVPMFKMADGCIRNTTPRGA